MGKSLIFHVAAFFLTVILAVSFLLLGACLPQGPIDENVRISAEGMAAQGCYPQMADHSFASTLDYTTDALILAESKATTIAHWETIFTNPLFHYDSAEGSAVENLFRYAQDPDPQPDGYYVQYWMGFRPILRFLLTFLDYYQILRYTALFFFLLFAAVFCSVANHTGTKSAFLFALSVILVRPHVIAVSLQFSCCFFLAFLAMLLIPWLHRTPRWETLFFLELGMLTQFFDFYTTPILTFCLPMTYLFLLQVREGATLKLRCMGVNALSWSAGYGFMWLAKLLLTSALTSADGFGTGLSSFMGRIGITKTLGLESYYNPLAALRTVAASLYSDREGKILLLIAVAAVFLLLGIRFCRQKHSLRELGKHWGLLVLAALPILWFMIAAQPTANHHWFQYRGIAATFWAGFVYLQLVFQKNADYLPASEI